MKKFLLIFMSIVTSVMLIMGSVFAADEADIFASKSYVDDKIASVMNLINGSDSPDNTGGAIPVAGASYVPVSVAVGQTIIGGEGTELILRAGKGNIVISGQDGIVNATTGQSLVNGHKATLNNIMIVPRADGRGVKVTEAAWFLVKGEYVLK